MDQSKILKLSTDIALINNKYESIAKATGSNYNIFQVLRIETKEVTTHSRMIADLLDPNGSHGMGSQFLALFLKVINEKENTTTPIRIPDNIDSVKCHVEKYCGPIDTENDKGGNIDIILEGLHRPLVIENKIYAPDQEKQLLRYSNQFNGNCDLIYLTLFGKMPDIESAGSQIQKVKLISYNTHILEWLEQCHQLAIDRPLFRETLKQYINLVKHLTGQSMNDEKNQEIYRFIEQHKESLKELYASLNNFVNNHLKNMIDEVFKEIMKDEDLVKLLAEVPIVYPTNGSFACHFKFGSAKERGVVFELRTLPEELSLWTTAWRWDGKDTYEKDSYLIEALNAVGRYKRPLDATLSIEKIAAEVIKGIKATKNYYDSIRVDQEKTINPAATNC